MNGIPDDIREKAANYPTQIRITRQEPGVYQMRFVKANGEGVVVEDRIGIDKVISKLREFAKA